MTNPVCRSRRTSRGFCAPTALQPPKPHLRWPRVDHPIRSSPLPTRAHPRHRRNPQIQRQRQSERHRSIAILNKQRNSTRQMNRRVPQPNPSVWRIKAIPPAGLKWGSAEMLEGHGVRWGFAGLAVIQEMGEPLRERASEDERFDSWYGSPPAGSRSRQDCRPTTCVELPGGLSWRSVRHYCGAIEPDVEMAAEKRDSTS